MGQADTFGLCPFMPVIPFLALNFVTCSEVVQNHVVLGIVKSSVQVGGQGKLTPHNHRNTDCHVSKQFVLGGMNCMKPVVSCLMFGLLCLIRCEP